MAALLGLAACSSKNETISPGIPPAAKDQRITFYEVFAGNDTIRFNHARMTYDAQGRILTLDDGYGITTYTYTNDIISSLYKIPVGDGRFYQFATTSYINKITGTTDSLIATNWIGEAAPYLKTLTKHTYNSQNGLVESVTYDMLRNNLYLKTDKIIRDPLNRPITVISGNYVSHYIFEDEPYVGQAFIYFPNQGVTTANHCYLATDLTITDTLGAVWSKWKYETTRNAAGLITEIKTHTLNASGVVQDTTRYSYQYASN
ncbi:hypothetical protein [Chitinophaga jiangningensis]|nr:hypothetical protein [Chitinophaga jiangningensis]